MNSQIIETFQKLIDKIKDKNIAIVPHTHADLDAIVSAFSLTILFRHANVCKPDIVLQDYPNKDAEKFINYIQGLSLDIIKEINIVNYEELNDKQKSKLGYEGYILVDTNSYELAPILKDKFVFGVIDHHNPDSFNINTDIYINDKDALANVSIIAYIIKHIDKPLLDKQNELGKIMNAMLAMGIISDTARFMSGSPETFELIAELIRNSGMSYEELRKLSRARRDETSRLAILSSLKKLEYRIINNYIVVVSEANNSESDVASILSNDVADVVFVVRWVNTERRTRISARAGVDFPIPLDVVMNKVGSQLGGAGGGHPKAAGAGVPVHSDQAIEMCLDIIADEISKLKE